ncbi:hypothetical protein J2W30_004659 [Variovorax boronicumulans]|uniref:hypothetical protein n=1 Tax=Variovorax boronicumulans TaxID=436515 RepID=UPI002783896A|nr:hypothetical protein [Variovorax boronicumulans]MDQ0036884.1 hypothetical protein [Variovorax boronicumulans]
MPTHIVDFSARSKVIRAEPFNAHFWKCTPAEFRAFLGRPREFLRKLGIVVPRECRIETTIENHDWLEDQAPAFESDSGNDPVICNMGCGAAARSVYRVVSYARDEAATGNFDKALLHRVDRQQVKDEDGTSARKKKKVGKSSKGKVSASRDSGREDDGE